MSLGFIMSAREMHGILIVNVLRWPMEIFDTTPLGRILNRFSKDVDVVDNALPAIFRFGLSMFFSVNFSVSQFFVSYFVSFKSFINHNKTFIAQCTQCQTYFIVYS